MAQFLHHQSRYLTRVAFITLLFDENGKFIGLLFAVVSDSSIFNCALVQVFRDTEDKDYALLKHPFSVNMLAVAANHRRNPVDSRRYK